MKTNLSTPPANPIKWIAVHESNGSRSTAIVTARTWYKARHEASALLGIEPGRLDVTPATAYEVKLAVKQ